MNCLNREEKRIRYWLKNECNEDNRDNELIMMDMVDDCIDRKDHLCYDYESL